MTGSPAALLHAADAAVARGDLAEGARLFDQALSIEDAGPQIWLKLAGLRRALRQPHKALDAVHGALRHTPLDFVALCLCAGLLERLDPAAAGSAWAEALAQRPSGEIPPHMAASIAAGEALRDSWLAHREAHYFAATQPGSDLATEDQAWKIARFRSNVLRKTRVWHSEPTHYHYPGLTEREFHPRTRFAWLEKLEAATPQIRAEMLAALESTRAELVPYLQYSPHEALAQWRELNHSLDWTAIHLVQQGVVNRANAALCPQTMDVLAGIQQPVIPGASPNVMFSLLAPGKTIPPHVGVNNTRLVCHLALVVPDGCWFRVGAETRRWREGEAFVFDDTIEHAAANPSDQLRVVMIFDTWHPDLSGPEREAVAALIAADGTPDGGL